MVLPPPDQYREGNLKDRLAASSTRPASTRGGSYWFDPSRETAFCLAEGPDRDCASQANATSVMCGSVKHQPKPL